MQPSKLCSVVSVPLGVILKTVPSASWPRHRRLSRRSSRRWLAPARRKGTRRHLVRRKLYSVVSVPLGVILKTVPQLPLAPPTYGCPVEVPVGGLHQPGVRGRPSAQSVAKAVQRGQRALGSDFEDRATAHVTVVAGPAIVGCPVEVPVAGLHQPGVRAAPSVGYPAKLCSVVKICAGEAIAVAAQNNKHDADHLQQAEFLHNATFWLTWVREPKSNTEFPFASQNKCNIHLA